MAKTVIIGSNHAGIAAANTLLDQYDNQEVVMIERNHYLSYLGCGTALWVGKQIVGYDELFYATAADFTAKGATIHMETVVERVDYRNRKVYCRRLTTNQEFIESYDHLILATGSKPIVPDLPGSQLTGIHVMKSFDESVVVDELLNSSHVQRVAVVGAGYIGVEMVEALKRRGKETLLFDVTDKVLSTYYDSAFADQMGQVLAENGIELHLNEPVTGYVGTSKSTSFVEYLQQVDAPDSLKPLISELEKTFTHVDERVCAIVTEKGEYPIDLVINAIGFKPNSDLGRDYLETTATGAYCVDRHQKTSSPRVYAVGDCATIYSNALHADTYIALASNAVRSGIVAAHNIAGQVVDSPGVQGSNGISIFGQHMVSTGLTLKQAEKQGFTALATDYTDWQKPGFMADNAQVSLRIVYDKTTRRILGAK